MTPSISVNNLNLAQGEVTDVERYFLFSGFADNAANEGKILQLDLDSDFDALLGANDSELKTQLTAARINGGQNWQAAAYVLATGETWENAIDAALAASVRPEGVIVCTPITAAADLNSMQAKAMTVLSTNMAWIWIYAAYRGINSATETWADYTTAAAAITTDVAAYRVGVVPQLHGNNLGVLAGRLANQAQSVADSPIRVASGPVLALGDTPVDSASESLSDAHLKTLDTQRFSVPWEYPGYEGTYWADGNLLDATGGDYQVIENLRVVDKAARRIYPRCVASVGNRELNNTPVSVAYYEGYFMRPLRDMSKTTVFLGKTYPGDIEPPEDGDIVITWQSNTEVTVYMSAKPYNAPKKITVNIGLDLS